VEVGRVLGALAATLNPSLILLGGELGAHSADLTLGVRQGIAQHPQSIAARIVNVAAAQMGSRSEVMGAIAVLLADEHRVREFAMRD
jgi:hypothetical protein